MVELEGYGGLLLKGTWVVVQLGLVSLLVGLIFGLIGVAAKSSRFAILRFIANAYTTIVRGIPEVVFVLFFYSALSLAWLALRKSLGYTGYSEVSAFWFGVFALAFMFGAYATEVFRMALQEIPKGQWEAAQSIGMRPNQIFFRIILPQMWAVALPGLGNLTLVLLKDTALVSLIGLHDLMFYAKGAAQTTQKPFTFYLVAAFIYLCLTIVTTFALSWAEKRANPALRYAEKLKKQQQPLANGGA